MARSLIRAFREGQFRLTLRAHAEGIERHCDERVIAEQADQIDHDLMTEAAHGGVVGRVGHALVLVELGGEVVDQLVIVVIKTRRFAIEASATSAGTHASSAIG